MNRHLSLKINSTSYSSILTSIKKAICSDVQITVNYLNFHSINQMLQSEELSESINNSDVVFPDGTGIWIASKFLHSHRWKRFNFTDHGFKFLEDCSGNNWSLFFLGSKNDTINKMQITINEKLPKLIAKGFHNGYENTDSEDLIETINKQNPDILLIGMGTPKQEIWINNFRHKLNASVIFSVGDLFNLFAGTKTRGPKFVRTLGLEWMFRIFSNPEIYFKRYILGIPKFAWNILNRNFYFSD